LEYYINIADSDGSWTTKDLCDADNDCISYWALDGNYLDSKGGNNGTPTGTTNSSGLSSGAIHFNGIGDRFITNSKFKIVNGSAISLWLKPNIYHTNDWLFASSTTTEAWALRLRGTYYQFQPTTSQSVYLYAPPPETGVWNHLLANINENGTIDLYLNGEYKNSSLMKGDIDVNVIGNWHPAFDGSGFNGTIDEILFYNDSLTTSEIEQLYKAGLSQHANTNITLKTRTAKFFG